MMAQPPSLLPTSERTGPQRDHLKLSGIGTAPVCDPTPDLTDLGFIDGHTTVVYSSFDDLVDRLHTYLDQPDQLRDIGRRAADLVRARHTWDHRAAFLEQLLRSPDPISSELSWDLITNRVQGDYP
jgi:hypothetical protein